MREIYPYLGIASVIVAFLSITLAILNAPWFSFWNNWLSDLGKTSGSAFFFNTGLIISGMLCIIFSYRLINSIRSARMLLVSSIFISLIGLFPSTTGVIHYAVSVMFFFTGILSLVVFSFESKGSERYAFIALALIASSVWILPIDMGKGAIKEVISASTISILVLRLFTVQKNIKK